MKPAAAPNKERDERHKNNYTQNQLFLFQELSVWLSALILIDGAAAQAQRTG
jgi:hypothetical protein